MFSWEFIIDPRCMHFLWHYGELAENVIHFPTPTTEIKPASFSYHEIIFEYISPLPPKSTLSPTCGDVHRLRLQGLSNTNMFSCCIRAQFSHDAIRYKLSMDLWSFSSLRLLLRRCNEWRWWWWYKDALLSWWREGSNNNNSMPHRKWMTTTSSCTWGYIINLIEIEQQLQRCVLLNTRSVSNTETRLRNGAELHVLYVWRYYYYYCHFLRWYM